MNDAPHINDRRRFKELWRELVARSLCAFIVAWLPGLIFWAVVHVRLWAGATTGGSNDLWRALSAMLFALSLAAPSAVAKRGKGVFPLVLVAALVGYAAAWFGAELTGVTDTHGGVFVPPIVLTHRPTLVETAATFCAAVGLVEGIYEGSVATALAGLFGGALTGASVVRGWAAPYWLTGLLDDGNVRFVTIVVLLHLGIGLSLALGRWIRDLPKRKQDKPESTQ